MGTDQGMSNAAHSGLFADVWDALADSPEEAADLKARSDLLMALQEELRGWGVARDVAALRLGIAPPPLDDLLRGKLHRFSRDELTNLMRVAKSEAGP